MVEVMGFYEKGVVVRPMEEGQQPSKRAYGVYHPKCLWHLKEMAPYIPQGVKKFFTTYESVGKF